MVCRRGVWIVYLVGSVVCARFVFSFCFVVAAWLVWLVVVCTFGGFVVYSLFGLFTLILVWFGFDCVADFGWLVVLGLVGWFALVFCVYVCCFALIVRLVWVCVCLLGSGSVLVL